MPFGGLITLAVLLPNLLVVRPPRPATAETEPVGGRTGGFEIVERLGQIGSFTIPFFYPLGAVEGSGAAALAAMAIGLGVYYFCWTRYLVGGRCVRLLFAPLGPLPLPLAVAPVIYFAAAAVYLTAWPLAIATALLGVGHLVVSWRTWQRLAGESARSQFTREGRN